jgi:uncharacterized protein (DUF1778 family)
MAHTEMRKVPINIRASAAQRSLVDSPAAAMNKSRSDFMLEASCRDAENVLLDQRLFLLQEKDFAAFEAARKTHLAEAMKKILSAKSPWEE